MDTDHGAPLPAAATQPDPRERGRDALSRCDYDAAAEWLETALAERPDDRDTIVALAEARLGQGRYREVLFSAGELLARDPADVTLRALVGAANAYLGELGEAVRLLSRTPDREAFHRARAFALERLGDLDEAERSARRAVAAAPERPEVWQTLGTVLAAQQRFGEALKAYGCALRVDTDFAPARLGRAHVRLALGDFLAWPDLAWQRCLPGHAEVFAPVAPEWDGRSPRGKTLLLVEEDSVSDTLMFVRYAATLKAAGARVLVLSRAGLVGLLARAEGVDRAVGDPAELADEQIDAQVDLLRLPALLETGLASIPREPYLRPDANRPARVANDPGAAGDAFRVAIHWANPERDRRSIPLRAFAPLASVPRVRLISVQTGIGADETSDAGLPVACPGPDLAAEPDELDATAAALTASDLVVTNDGPIAHLAGALALPVWVALPVGADWRWLVDRADSPWYPTMRLYRQRRQGDWSDVFEALAASLQAEIPLRPHHRGLGYAGSGRSDTDPASGVTAAASMLCGPR
jgi:tetratricopeptide (TPR) repeat protein